MTIDWAAVSGVAASIAVVVTLSLFIAQSRRRAVEEQARLKREAISRILTTMELSIRRNQGILSSLRFWSNPDLEYALAIPRLLHNLGPKNLHMSYWAFGQIQSMLTATSDKGASEIGMQMCMKLVEWGQGSVSDTWFKEALKSKSPPSVFHVPRRAQVLRGFNRTKSSVIALSALVVMAAALIKLGKELLEI